MKQLHITERNRWLVVAGAISIQLALGAIYAWSVFTKELQSGTYAFTTEQTFLIFSVGIATFSVVMIFAGRLLGKIGPGPLTVASGVTLGAGYIFAGLVGDSFQAQLVGIGLLGGAGIGLGYVVPIATAVKWYPGKEGLITGISVAGFGFGALIWIMLAGTWFGGGLLHSESLQAALGLPGVQSVFFVYGVMFTLLVLAGSVVMVNPTISPVAVSAVKIVVEGDLLAMTVKEMLKTSQYYALFAIFFFSAFAGLTAIVSIGLLGMDLLIFLGVSSIEAASIAGTAGASLAVMNALGRIAWGSISDRIGRRYAIALMVGLQGLTMLSIYHVFVHSGQGLGLVVVASLIGFNFGGNFALMPTVTADLFGKATMGRNYPYVFFAYGIAGITGPWLAGHFRDAAHASTSPIAWMVPFIVAGALCIVAATLVIFLKPVTIKAKALEV